MNTELSLVLHALSENVEYIFIYFSTSSTFIRYILYRLHRYFIFCQKSHSYVKLFLNTVAGDYCYLLSFRCKNSSV